MRTLKKSLALVLALVMLLGLGVVGASADNALDNYTDADEIGDAYLEAVGVLTGLGIVDGMTETTIVPQATYTRAQAAKIITTMVLGVNGAKSCVASYAPFDDVAANHWAAGYIAFCKEQGIIDGVTDTTFDPEGTLTGYQWAKMLLAAVGFNAKNELEGSSWSLNTARIGREVGLFDGDLAGADHTPLRREQAMLYAFNTLSAVRQVTWTTNGNNYVYDITFGNGGYIWADGTSQTLGEYVFDLNYAYGVVSDNEGMGATKTKLIDATVGSSKRTTIDIAANTGLDLMWHAVKIWFVGESSFTAVYTMDLAKTLTAECKDIDDLKKADFVDDFVDFYNNDAEAIAQNIGDKDDAAAKQYEEVLIDNRAYTGADEDGYVVAFYYTLEDIGTRSETRDTTVIGQYGAIDNDYIKTDISDISRGQETLVLKAGEKAYYVYAENATSGAVKEISSTGTITLTDGTVLTPSVFEGNNTDALNELKAALKSPYHSTPSAAFTLDTHGHYMYIGTDSFRTLGYFTGDLKADFNNIWSSDVAFLALFVDVATGEIEEVPVTNYWAKNIGHEGGYYDIRDELYGDETYTPKKVEKSDNIYGDSYVLAEDLDIQAGTHNLTFKNNGTTDTRVVFDNDDVTYYIASYRGSKLVVDEYTGNAELIEAYQKKYDYDIDTVSLTNVAAVIDNNGSNYTATVIFAWDGVATVSGGIVFFPYGVDKNDYNYTDSGLLYAMGYVNGEKGETRIYVSDELELEPGFYTYTINDKTGKYELDKYTGNDLFFSDSAEAEADDDYDKFWIDDIEVNSDAMVVDTRKVAADEKVDTVDELIELVYGDYNESPEPKAIDVAYQVQGGKIVLVYVVDMNNINVTATVAQTDANAGGWTTFAGDATSVSADTDSFTQPVWHTKTIGVTLETSYPDGFGMSSVGTIGVELIYENGDKEFVTLTSSDWEYDTTTTPITELTLNVPVSTLKGDVTINVLGWMA